MPNIEPFYSDLGRRIQQLRNAKRMTQAELGQMLFPPVTRASVANMESGKQRVLVHALVGLARALACNVNDLLPATVPKNERSSQETVAAELRQKLGLPVQRVETIARQMANGRRS